jgi:adenylate cyclase
MSHELQGELLPVGGGDPIPLIRPVLKVGRRESCDIPLKFPDISGIHCELIFREGYWYIRDLNSTNGVKVNGIRVQEKMLHPRDEISIGRKRRYTIQYEFPAGGKIREEDEVDIMSQSLLQKAGLEREPRQPRTRPTDEKGRRVIDPAERLEREEED